MVEPIPLKHKRIALEIYQPNEEVHLECQRLLLELVEGCIEDVDRVFTISEIEHAVDFHPLKQKDVPALHRVLDYGLFFHYSRDDSYNHEYETTCYYGNHGKKRTGRKGLTIYQKSEDQQRKTFVRLELLVNRGYIRENNLSIMKSLPISPDSLNVFDFFDYRLPLTSDLKEKMILRIEKILKKQRTENGFIAKKEHRALRNHMEMAFPIRKNSFNPIYQELSFFNELKNLLSLNISKDEYFPVSNKKELILEDLKLGYLQKEY